MTIKLLTLFIGALLINQVALVRLTAQTELSDNSPRRLSMTTSNTLLTIVALVLCMELFRLIDWYVLMPYQLRALYHFVYILFAAFATHLVCFVFSKVKQSSITAHIPSLLPLITINVLILGAIILALQLPSFAVYIAYTIAIAFIFSISLILLRHVDEKVAALDIPQPLKGLPILFITAGIILCAVSGFINFQ